MRPSDDFLNAVRFLTIVPVPAAQSTMDGDWLARSLAYFPLVGAAIGALSGAVLLIASGVWSGAIPALLAVAASVAVTGALHEDGLADTADGLGGGRTPERRLAIMKDSSIGVYGALALGFGVALRVAALAALPPSTAAAALVAVHAMARIAPAVVMSAMAYAGDAKAMKAGYSETPMTQFGKTWMAGVTLLALLPLAFVSVRAAIAGVLAGAVLAVWLMRRAKKLIGGYTGDVLGAVEQMVEIGFLLGVAAVMHSR